MTDIPKKSIIDITRPDGNCMTEEARRKFPSKYLSSNTEHWQTYLDLFHLMEYLLCTNISLVKCQTMWYSLTLSQTFHMAWVKSKTDKLLVNASIVKLITILGRLSTHRCLNDCNDLTSLNCQKFKDYKWLR